MKPWLIILLLCMVGGSLYALERVQRSRAEHRAHVAEQAVDSLKRLERAVDTVYLARVDTLRQWRTRWDSVLVARTDTLTVERVVYLADSTIRACEAVVETCEVRVGLARERADSAESAARQWKRIARGPFIRPAIEATTALGDWTPQAAAEVTLGRGALKVLGRLEVGQGAESCTFVPQTEGYACSRPVETTTRVGVRYTF